MRARTCTRSASCSTRCSPGACRSRRRRRSQLHSRTCARSRCGRASCAAAELAAALRSVDLGADDAVPAVLRDPTPPAGPAPAFHVTERRWLVPAALIVLAAAGLTAVGIALSRSEVFDVGGGSTGGTFE